MEIPLTCKNRLTLACYSEFACSHRKARQVRDWRMGQLVKQSAPRKAVQQGSLQPIRVVVAALPAATSHARAANEFGDRLRQTSPQSSMEASLEVQQHASLLCPISVNQACSSHDDVLVHSPSCLPACLLCACVRACQPACLPGCATAFVYLFIAGGSAGSSGSCRKVSGREGEGQRGFSQMGTYEGEGNVCTVEGKEEVRDLCFWS